MSVTFEVTLGTGSALGIEVPAESMAQLGPAKRYPVTVTIGDYTFRNSVSWYQGAYLIAFSAQNRSGAGVSPGDTITVTLEHDTAPRVLEMPAEVSAALTAAGVIDAFTALSYSKQRALVEPWAAAKTAATRDKNLAKIIAAAGGEAAS